MHVRLNGDEHEPLTSSLQQLMLVNLSELEHICVGPKRMMGFHSLQARRIYSCKKLNVIFSASVVRSLPFLKVLQVLECEELVHIVEEEYVTNVDGHLCPEPCFPNLDKVFVEHCDKLKYMFLVTLFDTLPKLRILAIGNTQELEHVLIRRGEMKEMVMKDVLPQLECLWLVKLLNLISIFHGTDFQALADKWDVKICDCPNFYFYGPKSADSESKENAEEKLSSHLSTKQYSNMGGATQQSFTKGTKEDAKKKIVEEDIIFEKPKMIDLSSDSNAKGLGELVEEEVKVETNMTEPKSQEEITRHDIQSYEEEESEGNGDLIVSCTIPLLSEQASEVILPPSSISSKASTGLNQSPQATLGKPIDDDNIQLSDKAHISDEGIKETNVGEDESMANSSEYLNVDPSNLKQMEQESSASSKGQIEHH